MKKINLIFLVIVSLLITGCDVDYNLLINSKKQVSETIRISSTNEAILNSNKNVKKYLDDTIKSYKRIDKFRDYTYKKNQGRIISSVMVSKKHNSLHDYANSSIFKQMFEGADINVTRDDVYTSFTTTGNKYWDTFYNEESEFQTFTLDVNKVKIKFYNGIVESNADKIDYKKNILEWDMGSDSKNKSIYFKVNNTLRYDIILLDFIWNNIIAIVAFGIILFILIILAIRTYIGYIKNGKL